MIEFELNGVLYRTNADASIVEARDPAGWNRTYSLRVLMRAAHVVQSAQTAREQDTQNNDPQFCPYCGGRNIRNVNGWVAHCHDDADNTADVDEWQCVDCDGRSFWS